MSIRRLIGPLMGMMLVLVTIAGTTAGCSGRPTVTPVPELTVAPTASPGPTATPLPPQPPRLLDRTPSRGEEQRADAALQRALAAVLGQTCHLTYRNAETTETPRSDTALSGRGSGR